MRVAGWHAFMHSPNVHLSGSVDFVMAAGDTLTLRMFEVGTYYQENKTYAEAVKAYRQFIFNFPRQGKVQDAMLAIARCHMARKAWNEALDAFKSYLSKFPTGKHAVRAKAQVEWIRMYHF